MGAPSLPGFRLDSMFFGFKPQDRVKLHESLFNLIWIGRGRWDWQTLYTMPVHIRRFWINKINKMLEEKEQQDIQRAQDAHNRRKKSKIPKSPL